MKLLATAATVLLATINLAAAAPSQPTKRQSPVITFEGAGPNPPSYTLTPPFDGTNVTISTFRQP